jgi:hypothetical protein
MFMISFYIVYIEEKNHQRLHHGEPTIGIHPVFSGPQLVFGIAPPGTGKTAVVSHILPEAQGFEKAVGCHSRYWGKS